MLTGQRGMYGEVSNDGLCSTVCTLNYLTLQRSQVSVIIRLIILLRKMLIFP